MFVKYFSILLFIFISGCSSLGGSKGSPYSALNEYKTGNGQVYIYRPSYFVMSLAIPTLKIDGETAMSVRNGSYTIYNLKPGQHNFVLDNNGNWAASKIEFNVTIKENERQFFRLSTEIDSIYAIGSAAAVTINGYFGQVSEEFAITELRHLLFTGSWPE